RDTARRRGGDDRGLKAGSYADGGRVGRAAATEGVPCPRAVMQAPVDFRLRIVHGREADLGAEVEEDVAGQPVRPLASGFGAHRAGDGTDAEGERGRDAKTVLDDPAVVAA